MQNFWRTRRKMTRSHTSHQAQRKEKFMKLEKFFIFFLSSKHSLSIWRHLWKRNKIWNFRQNESSISVCFFSLERCVYVYTRLGKWGKTSCNHFWLKSRRQVVETVVSGLKVEGMGTWSNLWWWNENLPVIKVSYHLFDGHCYQQPAYYPSEKEREDELITGSTRKFNFEVYRLVSHFVYLSWVIRRRRVIKDN
jgi:hypothetical protein